MEPKIINPANSITFVRLLLGFGLLYFLYAQNKIVSIVLYLIFLLLDYVDGFVASKLNCETTFGKNFDFITDGGVGFAAALILITQGIIPLDYVLLIAGAIFLLTVAVIWGFHIRKNTFIPAKWGKINGAIFYLILLLFVINAQWSVTVAYVLLVYVYVSRIKHLMEIYSISK